MKKASMILTAGSIIFSGAFLLLSLNYANNVGLFYTKSSMPAQFFANQMEAALSGIYSSPEEATISYSGPRSCRWDSDNLEYVCTGGGRIKNIGAVAAFTQNHYMAGFPLTTCIYVNLIGAITAKLKGESLKRTTLKELLTLPKNWLKKRTLKKLEKEIIEEAAEIAAREGSEAALKRISERLGRDLEGEVKDFAEELARREIAKAGKELSEKEYYILLGETKERIKNDIFQSIRSESNDIYSQGLMIRMAEKAKEAGLEGLRDIFKRQAIYMDALSETLETAMRTGGVEAVDEIVKRGWTDKAKDFLSRIFVSRTRKGLFLRGLVGYLSCGNDNPLLDAIDFFLNGQLVLETDYRQIATPYTFFVGKTGALYLTYKTGNEEKDLNKLFVLNGDDMCATREFLAYNLTDYSPKPFKIVDGDIILEKNKVLYDTICDKSSTYYPTGIPEIVEYVEQACNSENGKSLHPIRIYATPSRFISKDGTKICEEKVIRNSKASMTGSFKIFCYDLSNLCEVDLGEFNPVPSWFNDYANIEGNYYFAPEDPEITLRSKITSPLASAFGIEGLQLPEVELPKFNLFTGNNKQFYFPSRYDYVEVRAEKENGKVYLKNIKEENVMGANFKGIYTEYQKLG